MSHNSYNILILSVWKIIFTVQSCVVIWLLFFSCSCILIKAFMLSTLSVLSLFDASIFLVSHFLYRENRLWSNFHFNVNCHPYSFLTDTCNFFSLDVFFFIFGFLWFVFLPIFLSQLLMILLKVADISNECRPMDVAEPWLECLLQEFFNQV